MYDFSRNNRLVSKADFQSVFAQPFKVSRKRLLALYRPNLGPCARLGIVIAKHHVKHAVDRNQVRRVIRESFRHQKEALKGLDIILLIRSECSPANGLNKKVLRLDVDNLWLDLIKSSRRV